MVLELALYMTPRQTKGSYWIRGRCPPTAEADQEEELSPISTKPKTKRR
jgi:hypothetical protein